MGWESGSDGLLSTEYRLRPDMSARSVSEVQLLGNSLQRKVLPVRLADTSAAISLWLSRV